MKTEMSTRQWLPTNKREMEARGWDAADVIIFSGDAYVDHPSFGVAVIGRVLEAEGLRVAIVPQPDWHGDLRDFKRLGRPRLFFAISPGAMDSMVNKYTAGKRLRSEDAYSPDGRHDLRPEMPTIIYTQALKKLYPEVPVVIGGIEASMRRLAHYDYWQDRIRPSILVESGADLLVYGMGERPMAEIADRLNAAINEYVPTLDYDPINGEPLINAETFSEAVRGVPQTVRIESGDNFDILDNFENVKNVDNAKTIELAPYEACLQAPRSQSLNFKTIEEESNRWNAARLVQKTGKAWVIQEPQYPPMTTVELDAVYDLPFTRLPHPKYDGKRIPAYEMIRHSITLHRGCFGGCAFCTISAHQGKFITSRSKESIMREVEAVTQMPDFRGTISDLGGPSANMYGMTGRDLDRCRCCRRPSCIHPKVCPNLNVDHRPLTDIYKEVEAVRAVKHSYIGSGVRYDLILHHNDDEVLNRASIDYARCLITCHVSGRLKVAPEHTSDEVLMLMRKPSFKLFHQFKRLFDSICREAGLRQQLIPYFISSHPGCRAEDMAELAVETKALDFQLEQVQDFTPTPMTVSTETWATGLHPYTQQPVFCAKTPAAKRAQRMFFFWYKPEERRAITDELRRMNRIDLLKRLYPQPISPIGKGE